MTREMMISGVRKKKKESKRGDKKPGKNCVSDTRTTTQESMYRVDVISIDSQ